MTIKSLKSNFQVIALPWGITNPTSNTIAEEGANSSAFKIDISKYILGGSIAKSISAPAGTFNFSLPNSHDWKQILKPGTWCLLYLSNGWELRHSTVEDQHINNEPNKVPSLQGKPPRKNLRCLGYIERVAIDYIFDPDTGGRSVQYTVSGRDFGIVYEQTQIWLNFFKIESTLVNSLSTLLQVESLQTLDRLLDVVHRLFLNPKSIRQLAAKDSLTELGLQWLLPTPVFDLLELTRESDSIGTYFGNISTLLQISPSKSPINVVNPLSNLNGNLWERLKSLSQEQFHELYTELSDDGSPNLIFRPIPWITAKDRNNFKDIASVIKTFKELADVAVRISQDEIYGFNLGEDTHARYNHFFTQIVNAVTPNSNVDVLKFAPSVSGRRYPHVEKASIARHGFRPMHTEINDFKIGTEKLLHQFNEVLYDYWANAFQYESGSLEIPGRNDIKLGKVIRFEKEVEYIGDKVFYVEGYTDDFVVDENGATSWVQNLTLTRGIEYSVLSGDKPLGERPTPFDNTDSFTGDSNE